MDRSPAPSQSTPPATSSQDGIARDFWQWLNVELNRPGFSTVRMLVVVIACVATMLALQPIAG